MLYYLEGALYTGHAPATVSRVSTQSSVVVVGGVHCASAISQDASVDLSQWSTQM